MSIRKPMSARTAIRRVAFAAAACGMLALGACGKDSPTSLMDKASASLAAKDPKAAEIHLKNLLQQKPDDAQARTMLAGIHSANRDARSAEKEWARALGLGASPDAALPGLLEARVRLNEPKSALDAAAKWQATEPTAKAAVAYWTGRAYDLLGNSVEAESAWRAALALAPDFHKAWVALLRRQAARGDTAGAATAIDALLAVAPAEPDALLLKAEIQLARADSAGARETLSKAIAASPAELEPRLRLMALLIETRDFAAAEAQRAELRKVSPGSIQATYLGALLDFRQGRLDAARDGSQAVLKVAPDYLPAILLAANVALAQNSLELAETHARKILERSPQSLQGQRLLSAIMLKRNDPARALEFAQDAIAKGASDAGILNIAGEAALRRSDFAAATAYFERAVGLDPKGAAARTGLGLAQLSSGQRDAGVASLESAAELDQRSEHADLALIAARTRAGQFDQAFAAVDRLERKQPGKPIAHDLRGAVHLAKGDGASARASFESALERDPAYFPAVAHLALMDAAEGRVADARARFESLLRKDPKSVQGWLALASLAGRQPGSNEDAEAVLKRAHAANPASVDLTLALARRQIDSGAARDAVPLLQTAVSQNGDLPGLLEALAAALWRSGQQQQAIDAFDRRIRLAPSEALLHVRLAEMKAGAADIGGAVASLRRAIELDPKSSANWAGLVSRLLDSDQRPAVRQLATALQQDAPRSPLGALIEGDVLASEGQWPQAAAAYRKSLAIQRSTAGVVRLHRALLRTDRASEAELLLRDAVRAMPKDLGLRLYAGEVAVGSKHWRLAIDHYDIAVKLAPDNIVALNNLAWALHEVGDTRALAFAEDAYARAPGSAPVADTLGVILLDRGDAERGLRLLKSATQLAPKNPQHSLRYAEALARMGDRSGARAAIGTLVQTFPNTQEAEKARKLAASL